MVPLQSVPSGVLFAVALGSLALFAGAALYVYYWIYQDAKVNSPHSAGTWVAVSVLFPLFGVILYFLVGRVAPTGHRDGPGTGR